MKFAQLCTTTNYTFLSGASHPQEYVARATMLNYSALAITDEASLAGIVKAYAAIKASDSPLKLIIGSLFKLSNGIQIIALAPHRKAYAELSGFITLTRRRSPKGQYQAHIEDLRFRLQHCFIIWAADPKLETTSPNTINIGKALVKAFKHRLWIGINLQLSGGEDKQLHQWTELSKQLRLPLTACSHILMHDANQKPLQDVLTGIRTNTPINKLGTQLEANTEAYLKSLPQLRALYPQPLIEEANNIANRCQFTLGELQYQYPPELVPSQLTPIQHLRNLVDKGKHQRYPNGIPEEVNGILEKELILIEKLHYEYFFLTVYDIVQFAQKQKILYQGRGSAANSIVCYCLHITEISPEQINVLFERFISEERNEPPDIDVDFEHSRREEVIQYIYRKYDREHAAIAATVVTYRSRSAIRDVGKAMGLEPGLIDHLAKSLAWWDRTKDLQKRIETAGLAQHKKTLMQFFHIVQRILGFPRHLSQHVGGFVITKDKVSDLVPLENASMPDRTIIQWDKDDLETMGLLKVDVLSLGMLTALRKAVHYVSQYSPTISRLQDIPKEDPATYNMLSAGDTIGVFQVESRAQMSMLPRLKPKKFYDLVIEIAIVRPGPIQGDMVHPYLRRRDGLEETTYLNDDIKGVLEPTLGVPIFQEQAIRLAMVAAGFSGGEADALRRSMASWGKNGNLLQFEQKFIQGMTANGYPINFAQRVFEQIKGFGGYGFPESHSASFAILCYFSSWLKCHHPAAFYCALLNSQPMGFYTPSQLIQDARRHHIKILPVDINKSNYESHLEPAGTHKNKNQTWAIRLGFNQIKQLNKEQAKRIELIRREKPFKNLEELTLRANFLSTDLQALAAADSLSCLMGNRHNAHWHTSATRPVNPLLQKAENNEQELLLMQPPHMEKDITDDYATLGLTLRAHPMAVLRNEHPFNRCTRQNELIHMQHGRFVRVAGLITGRQRPGTAKGTIFLTLEDETGNMNIVVWKNTQETFRQILLTAKLIMVKGVVEISHNPEKPENAVIHIIAGQLIDYSQRLEDNFNIKSRDFH